MKKIFLVLTFFIFTSAANAETLSKENKDKACLLYTSDAADD